jgi:BA14K-like protein
MTTSKILIAAALVSMAAVTSASAQQTPNWALVNPDAYQAEFPNGDVSGGARMAPVFRESNAYAAASSCAQRHHSYDPASGTFLGYDGRRHSCE